MAECRFTNFDIAVHGQAAPYPIRATYGAHAAEGELEEDSTDAYWRDRALQLGDLRLQPGQGLLEEAGARLFRALLRDQLRDLWVRARSDVETQTIEGLRVRLSTSSPAVTALPWEAMFDADRRLAFAGSLQTPLVRVANLLRYVGHMRPLATRLPLRIVVALPDDPSGRIDGASEWQRIEDAVAPLIPEGIVLDRVGGPIDILALRRQLEQQKPDVLHLITHGQPDSILLWQEGRPVWLPASSLRVVMESVPSLKLCVLNSCATTRSSAGLPMASIGTQLLQAGLAAVVAMQFDLRESAAAHFAEFFYTELVAGRCPGAVDIAVSYARSNLYALNPHTFDYGTPVLWLNAEDGRIFTPDRRILVRPRSAGATGSINAKVDLTALQAQVDEIQDWLATLPQTRDAVVPSGAKSIFSEWQDNVQEIRGLLTQIETPGLTQATAALCQQKLERISKIRQKLYPVTPLITTFLEKRSG